MEIKPYTMWQKKGETASDVEGRPYLGVGVMAIVERVEGEDVYFVEHRDPFKDYRNMPAGRLSSADFARRFTFVKTLGD